MYIRTLVHFQGHRIPVSLRDGEKLEYEKLIITPDMKEGKTDLFVAVEAGDLERVQELVEQEVDKEKCNAIGQTPLGIASGYGHLTVVRYLVEQGADMEKVNSVGWTPLMIASWKGHLETVSYLLEQGANRDKADKWRKSSLHCAAQKGHLEITKLLMAYGADLTDLNARTHNGQLPIDQACTEEIRQAIYDEPRRRMDEAPGKRCIEQDRHPNLASSASASTQKEDNQDDQSIKQHAEGEAEEGIVADEDQDSEPSSDEDNLSL